MVKQLIGYHDVIFLQLMGARSIFLAAQRSHWVTLIKGVSNFLSSSLWCGWSAFIVRSKLFLLPI